MEPIVSLSQLDPNGFYTYADYLLWQFSERVEIIKGKLFPMAAPARRHQRICDDLLRQFHSCIPRGRCEICIAPFDVRLPIAKNERQVTTTVQPDICVVCDPAKLDDKGCSGAPDLVVEILSPSNAIHDLKRKMSLYQESGVKEYWIVQTDYLQQFVLNDRGHYEINGTFVHGETVQSAVLPNLSVDLSEVLDIPPPLPVDEFAGTRI